MTGGKWRGADFEAVMRLVGERTGLTDPPGRREGIRAGIRRAAARTGVAHPARYLALLQADGAALDDLLNELTIGETYFFREPAQFDFIRGEVLPRLLSERGAVRAWSAGCATGEEAYSLAILLQELGARAQVVGTDISRERLAHARRACYTGWSLRGVPEPVVERYFRRGRNRFELSSRVRGAVTFRPLNLADDAYPSAASGIWGMDLVLCRNVLIYLDPGTVARVARRLLNSLSQEGWLFLGASDPPLSDLVPCEVVVTGAGVAYRRAGRSTVGTAVFAPGAEAASVSAPPAVEAPRASLPRALPEETAQGSPPPAERDDADADLCIARVRVLANQGRLADAGRACAAALDRHRTSAELAYLHSVLLAEAGLNREAAQAARRALYLDRGLAVAHLSLGAALTRLGDAEGARRALRNADDLLSSLSPAEVVPASDGELAGRLAEMVRVQLRLLGEKAA